MFSKQTVIFILIAFASLSHITNGNRICLSYYSNTLKSFLALQDIICVLLTKNLEWILHNIKLTEDECYMTSMPYETWVYRIHVYCAVPNFYRMYRVICKRLRLCLFSYLCIFNVDWCLLNFAGKFSPWVFFPILK